MAAPCLRAAARRYSLDAHGSCRNHTLLPALLCRCGRCWLCSAIKRTAALAAVNWFHTRLARFTRDAARFQSAQTQPRCAARSPAREELGHPILPAGTPAFSYHRFGTHYQDYAGSFTGTIFALRTYSTTISMTLAAWAL